MTENWMTTIREPIRYRVNTRVNLNFNSKFAAMSIVLLTLLVLLYVLVANQRLGVYDNAPTHHFDDSYRVYRVNDDPIAYNHTYPLSAPVRSRKDKTLTYSWMAIADLDTNSKESKGNGKYKSYMLQGKLVISEDLRIAQIDFDVDPVKLSSQYSYGERGMELSELVVFNGKLYSCDDRTGIIYQVDAHNSQVIPWVILGDGDGHSTGKGFKCEWMTVKDEKLYVGGLGKEWTTGDGELVNHNPLWIKVVGHLGDVVHVDWKTSYENLRRPGGYTFPGYMIFESGAWSRANRQWYFLPRRACQERYDEKLDEKRATNLLITADEHVRDVKYMTVGEVRPLRGYSSFKFVPNSGDQLIIALKTEEDNGQTRSFITLLNVNGTVMLKDEMISEKYKFEGIEFV